MLVYTVHIVNNKQKEDNATLEILQAIESNNDVTQRHLADRLDVALGLANSYLKRCVRKGLVKIHQAPANRYFYYLTPKGFSEKSRLTTEYLSSSFDFYRKASNSIIQIFRECENKKKRKIIFCGISELTEISIIRADEFDILTVGIFDFDSERKELLKLPVSNKLNSLNKYDTCIITSLKSADKYLNFLIKEIDRKKIMMPEILGIRQQKMN